MNRLMTGMKVMAVLVFLGASSAAMAVVDINGGSSWGGWTSQGLSDQLGVYGRGSATAKYEVYSTVFSFNNDPITGSPTMAGSPTPSGFASGTYSPGAFTVGNLILGIGVRVVSGGSIIGFTPTVKFDLGNDSFQAATSVPGADGRTSFSTYAQTGDFTVQFEGANSWRPSNITVATNNGSFYGGTSLTLQLPGGVGSGTSYDFAFRAFAQESGSGTYQMFFDLTAMQVLYGTGAGNIFPGPSGIGMIGNDFKVAVNGLGNNEVTFGATIPEPGTLALVSLGLGGLLIARKRK